MGRPSSDRLRVTYDILAPSPEAARERARDIAVEQTAEIPAHCIPAPTRRLIGRVGRVASVSAARWRVVISYHPDAVGADPLQLFNLVFGNISLMSGIRVVGLTLPPNVLARFPGPTFGIAGLRRLCGVTDRRPLLCAAAKPMGLSSKQLARICYAFAAGGVDIIKDDHGLARQRPAAFEDRIARCQEAVEAANARTGGTAVYFPNVSRGGTGLIEDMEYARALGCRGVMLAPALIGFDSVRQVAQRGRMAILSHPTLAGALFQPRHGVAPEIVLGVWYRLIGSDGVIYPNAGGRFPWSAATCEAINYELRAPLAGIKPAMPVAGGGVDTRRVPYWIDRYGPDTTFLVGSSFYAQGDLRRAAERLSLAIKRHRT